MVCVRDRERPCCRRSARNESFARYRPRLHPMPLPVLVLAACACAALARPVIPDVYQMTVRARGCQRRQLWGCNGGTPADLARPLAPLFVGQGRLTVTPPSLTCGLLLATHRALAVFDVDQVNMSTASVHGVAVAPLLYAVVSPMGTVELTTDAAGHGGSVTFAVPFQTCAVFDPSAGTCQVRLVHTQNIFLRRCWVWLALGGAK